MNDTDNDTDNENVNDNDNDNSTDVETDVDQDSIEVHWQHPRTELELPLLLVWPSPVVDEWVATIENGVATVVCHEWLEDVGDEKEVIEKRAEEWGTDEPIPTYVAEALLSYDGNYGPVLEVMNPYDEPETSEDSDVDAYQNRLPSR